MSETVMGVPGEIRDAFIPVARGSQRVGVNPRGDPDVAHRDQIGVACVVAFLLASIRADARLGTPGTVHSIHRHNIGFDLDLACSR